MSAGRPRERDRAKPGFVSLRIDCATGEVLNCQDGPDPLPTPRSFADVLTLVAPYGELVLEDFLAAGTRARRGCYGERERLTRGERRLMLQLASCVALRLRDAYDPGLFPPPSTSEVEGLWGEALAGTFLGHPLPNVVPVG